MTEFDREAARRAIDTAHQMVVALCEGERRWIMSIPARPGHDPDLVIADGLEAGKKALFEIDRLRKEVERLRQEGRGDAGGAGPGSCAPHEAPSGLRHSAAIPIAERHFGPLQLDQMSGYEDSSGRWVHLDFAAGGSPDILTASLVVPPETARALTLFDDYEIALRPAQGIVTRRDETRSGSVERSEIEPARPAADMPKHPELDRLLAESRAKVDAMSPEEREAMLAEQRKSWVRGEMAMRDESRTGRPVDAPNPTGEGESHVG